MTIPFVESDPSIIAEQRIVSDGMERPGEAAPAARRPVQRDLGYILDEPDEEKVAKHMIQLGEEQEPEMSRRRAVWKRNRWWREGRRWVRLEKRENTNLWEAKLPYGAGSAPPVPNKTDRICRRIINTVLVDKPYPDCEPGDDTNEARDSAEFSTRYLKEQGSEAQLDMNRLLRKAADKSETFASAFGWVTIDPMAGGHRPRVLLAHPEAQTEQDALLDPSTGLPASQTQLRERYLRADGGITDEPSEADLQWLPGPKVRTLTGLQLRMLPKTCEGLEDAHGVVISDLTTLGDLKKQFPDRFEGPQALTAEQLTQLCEWRPTHVEDLLPPYVKLPDDQKFEGGPRDGEWKDSQSVVVTVVYYQSCAEYPYGCYAIAAADKFVLHRQQWSAMMPATSAEGDAATGEVEECLDLPVAQCRCLDDDVNDDPYGIAMSEHLGPADEIRATALGFQLEYMFRASNPIAMLPVGSIVQPKAFLRRDGEPIYVNPQGKPEWEQIPPLTAVVAELRKEMGDEIDDEAGLQQAAQGVESPTVKSGIHAQVIVQEALKALTGFKDNIGSYYTGLNRIILQLTRAYCEVPQLLTYTGDDGEYKAREWTRADFRDTRVVAIAKGSFTMHTLLAKQELANAAFDRKVIDADEYTDLVTNGVSPVLGTQQNPSLMRVRRQLERFWEGPPQGWLEQVQQVEQANAMAMAAYQQQVAAVQQVASVAPALDAGGPPAPSVADPGAPGAPLGPAVPPPPAPIPPPPGPFSDQLPMDDEPMAAKIRHRQLRRAGESSRFQSAKYPDPWRQTLLAEYAKAKNAAGVMTVPEVQAAKAAEAAAMPPALPKGVSIAMKGTEATVAGEEQAALAGFGKGGGAGAAAPGPPPSTVTAS
jgi:hypothetical protein